MKQLTSADSIDDLLAQHEYSLLYFTISARLLISNGKKNESIYNESRIIKE